AARLMFCTRLSDADLAFVPTSVVRTCVWVGPNVPPPLEPLTVAWASTRSSLAVATIDVPGVLLFVTVDGFCPVRASARIGLLSTVACGGAVGWSTRMRLPAFDASGPGHTTLASAYPIGPLARLAEASGTSPSWFPLVASS